MKRLGKLFSRLFAIAMIIISAISVYERYQVYLYEMAIFEEIQYEYAQARQLNQQLYHELAYHLSDAYVEIAAREMGLVHQREILFRPIN